MLYTKPLTEKTTTAHYLTTLHLSTFRFFSYFDGKTWLANLHQISQVNASGLARKSLHARTPLSKNFS